MIVTDLLGRLNPCLRGGMQKYVGKSRKTLYFFHLKTDQYMRVDILGVNASNRTSRRCSSAYRAVVHISVSSTRFLEPGVQTLHYKCSTRCSFVIFFLPLYQPQSTESHITRHLSWLFFFKIDQHFRSRRLCFHQMKSFM